MGTMTSVLDGYMQIHAEHTTAKCQSRLMYRWQHSEVAQCSMAQQGQVEDALNAVPVVMVTGMLAWVGWVGGGH